MIDAQTYLEHIMRDGTRIPAAAQGSLEEPVPSCPGNTVESLLMHTASLYMFWSAAIQQNARPEVDWTAMDKDLLAANRIGLERFVELLRSRDSDQATWTWAGEGNMRFWYRRAAQELAVHRWDFENAVAEPMPIDPELAADGIDELLHVFGPATGMAEYPGASERFGGDGETFRLEPTDFTAAITFKAHPDRFESDASSEPHVTARGTASDLLLFMWGRVPPSMLDAIGDASLLDRWQERVKI